MRNILSVVMFIVCLPAIAWAKQGVFDELRPNYDTLYIARLTTGDIIEGTVREVYDSRDNGPTIKFGTDMGVVTLYEEQVAEIVLKYHYYRSNHRHILLPTAVPIGDDFFIGTIEGLMLYGGFGLPDFFGIGDIFSFNWGRSVVPGLQSPSADQISFFNAKATLMNAPYPGIAKNFALAVGANWTWVNHDNRLIHLFANGSMHFDRTQLTAMVFYKQGAGDHYLVRFTSEFNPQFMYQDGRFGLGLGIDTKFSERHDLHFVGEVWTNNVTEPTNAAVLLGFRHCNTSFTTDFGIAFITAPFAAPYISFVWTPF